MSSLQYYTFLFEHFIYQEKMRYFGVEIFRQNFTDLSTEQKPCSEWKALTDLQGKATEQLPQLITILLFVIREALLI